MHYVLFSQHSSRGELAAALEALRPRAVRPINQDQVTNCTVYRFPNAGLERGPRSSRTMCNACPGRTYGRTAALAFASKDWP